MISIKNFSKSYNGTTVLEIPDLSLPEGIFWIKGDNGSGKSTFFKSLAGIIPYQGSVLCAGVNAQSQPFAYRKLVNFSEAEPAFPGFLTCKDLVRFIAKTRNAPLQQQDHYSKLFGIDQYFTKPCETFSSGMLKKLSLASAFLGTPKVIILDEPLITLDAHARQLLNTAILEAQERGTTFLISSHQLLEDLSLKVTGTFIVEHKTLNRA
jgi:ABC-2 type transport system ATP-binding protein